MEHSHKAFRQTWVAASVATALLGFSASAQESPDKESVGIEVLEVTAQKRVENIQQVPIAISAFSEQSLRKIGAQSINDLGNITPGFETNVTSPTQPKYDIRGIRTNDFGIGADPAVGIYVDDVYVGRSGSALMNFNDVERVEVLKGPQGTLFGRNTAAGAVRIINKKPTDDTEGNYRITLGNLNKRQFEGLYNTAISDDLFWRTSVNFSDRGGYVDAIRYPNPRTDEDFKPMRVKLGDESSQGIRTALRYVPSDSLEMIWRAEFEEMDNDARPVYSANPSYYRQGGGGLHPFGVYETDMDAMESRHLFGTSLEINKELDIGTLTSITAYRRFDTENHTEDDGSGEARGFFSSNNLEHQKFFSQEFRLAGVTDGGMRWTVGTTYANEDIHQETIAEFMMESLDSFAINESLAAAGLPPTGAPSLGVPGIMDLPVGTGLTNFLLQLIPNELAFLSGVTGVPVNDLAWRITRHNLGKPWTEVTENFGDYTSYALFADVTYPVTDKLDLTLGVRYTRDEKDFGILSQYQNQIDFPFPGVPSQDFGLAFATEYVLRDDQGNPVLDGNGNVQPFEQDNTWTKLTPRVVLDYQWTNNLMTYASFASGFKAGGFNSLGAAPPFDQEEVDNMEIGMKSTLLDNKLKLNIAAFDYDYTNLQILRLTGSTGNIPVYNVRNVDAAGKGVEIESEWAVTDNFLLNFNYAYLDSEYTKYSLFVGETAEDDLTGKPLAGVPKNRWFVGADYFIEAANGEYLLHLDVTTVDERSTAGDADSIARLPVNPALVPGLTGDNKVEGYSLVNARIAYRSNDDWQVALFARNLLDEEYLLSGYGGQGENTGSANLSPGLPRMWGVEFSQSF
ncbi:TonB-dependent receptor [Aliiglaciecola sp. CAU 1673]|uniref:TonB-dependent receptor n=1 Tax=Aliiglaciecola sp. CAU 1673 TaxID=3032595 RepID=UPI0023DC1F26|nr:TonB-dependent receptor [Aliiglaciecola sp. CAU 1673]MDF2179009.1 TonB-dependent receptor [Aliiglaciecola sp. CAU 1673]